MSQEPSENVEPAKAKVIATPDMVVVHPEFGEITVGELLKKLEEKRAITPGVQKKLEIAKAVLTKLWPRGVITASVFNEVNNEVKKEKEVRFTPSINFYVTNGWMVPVRQPGKRPYYLITKQGAEFAGIDITKPVPKPPEIEIKEAAEEVVEFLEEDR